MKKALESRAVAISSILDCNAMFYQMPSKLKAQQVKLLRQIDEALSKSASNFEDDLFNRPLPAISNDEAWASLSASEKAFANSLENGGALDAAESYHQSKLTDCTKISKKV